MKLSKISLLFIAALFMLVLPLSFTAGTASAAQFVHNDGAAFNANGGYQLPVGKCIVPGTADTTPADGIPDAQVLSASTKQACDTAIAAYTDVSPAITDYAKCVANGYIYSINSSGTTIKCTTRGWDTINPDTGNLYGTDKYNGTITGNQGCLRCHNSDYMYNHDPIAAKEKYLLMGHRNMLRKVTAQYGQWLNGDTAASTPAGTVAAGTKLNLGNVDWTTSNSTVPGFPIVSGATSYGLNNTTAYIYGGWYKNKVMAKLLRTTPAPDSPSKVATGGTYCGAECHSTGWDMPTTPSPAQPSQPGTLINGSSAGETWVYNGIQCTRCHDHSAESAETETTDYSTGHNNGELFENQVSIQLCYQCHSQEGPAMADQAQNIVTGNHGSYAASFSGHYRTNQFLNSPHARFSGTIGDMGDGTKYTTHFYAGTCSDEFLTNSTDCKAAGETWTSAGNGSNGCVACHDVHTSAVDPDVMDPTTTDSNIKAGASCGTSCHSYINLAKINHPVAPQTPLDGDLSTTKGKLLACTTCHMTGVSASSTSHIFRIEPDPSYSTFPNSVQFTAGQTWANTEPDESHPTYNAVYMDVNLVCGQCHGGTNIDTGAQQASLAGVPAFSKAQLGQLAENMHNTYPTQQDFTAFNGGTSYSMNFNASLNSCPSGVASCTYAWDFGDGTTGSGSSTSHSYAATTKGAAVLVTMTVNTSAYTSGTATKTVTPLAVAGVPTVGGLSSLTSAGMGVQFKDASSDPASAGAGVTDTVYVNWGDGSPMASGATGSTFSHTYILNGTFTIVHKIRNSAGWSAQETKTVTMNSNGGGVVTYGTVNITSGGTAGTYATYYVKQLDTNSGLTLTKLSSYVIVPGGASITTLPQGNNYSFFVYGSGGKTCTVTKDTVAYTNGTLFNIGGTPIAIAITCN